MKDGIQKALDDVGDYPCAVLSISPQSPNVSAGSTLQIVATAKDPTGKLLPTPTGLVWSSNNNATATVGATGIVAGVAVGQANITVTDPLTKNSVSATINVTAVTTSIGPVTAKLIFLPNPAGGVFFGVQYNCTGVCPAEIPDRLFQATATVGCKVKTTWTDGSPPFMGSVTQSYGLLRFTDSTGLIPGQQSQTSPYYTYGPKGFGIDAENITCDAVSGTYRVVNAKGIITSFDLRIESASVTY